MTTVFQQEGWAREDLEACSVSQLRSLAGSLDYPLPANATKADLVALMVGEVIKQPAPPTPEELLQEANRLEIQTKQWQRGVPPGEVLLTAHDKLWLDKMWNAAA